LKADRLQPYKNQTNYKKEMDRKSLCSKLFFYYPLEQILFRTKVIWPVRRLTVKTEERLLHRVQLDKDPQFFYVEAEYNNRFDFEKKLASQKPLLSFSPEFDLNKRLRQIK
jgi:hypothetical protein